MTDMLAGVNAKLNRAERHLAELHEEIGTFFKRGPFQIERLEEPDGGVLYRVRVREEPPIQLSAIFGDAIHCLRTSLDLLAGQLVVKNGGTPTRDTCFPIAETEGGFRQLLGKALAGASKRAIGAVRQIKAYRGGTTNLWLLHHLDIVDKHRLLLTVGCAYSTLSLDFAEMFRAMPEWSEKVPEMRVGLRPDDRLFPLKDGGELYRISAEARKDPEPSDLSPQFKFEVAFAGGEVTEGQNIGETAASLREAVHEVVNRLEPLLR